MNLAKLAPSHLRKVFKARKRWAWRGVEDRVGLFVRRWPMPFTAPAELGHLLRSLEVNCVIDVGAHVGGFGHICRRLGFDGDIVSFEPAPATCRRLRRATSTDPRWTVHQLALGSETSKLKLGIYDQTQLNSLLHPDKAALGSIDARLQTTEVVDVVRLDDIWSDLIPDGGRVLLKIDAQGFDLEVLKGAQETLPRCVALQVEVSGVALYEGSPPLHQVITYLYDRSFRITGLFPIARSRADRIQIIDFDATFVRVPIPRSDP